MVCVVVMSQRAFTGAWGESRNQRTSALRVISESVCDACVIFSFHFASFVWVCAKILWSCALEARGIHGVKDGVDGAGEPDCE